MRCVRCGRLLYPDGAHFGFFCKPERKDELL